MVAGDAQPPLSLSKGRVGTPPRTGARRPRRAVRRDSGLQAAWIRCAELGGFDAPQDTFRRTVEFPSIPQFRKCGRKPMGIARTEAALPAMKGCSSCRCGQPVVAGLVLHNPARGRAWRRLLRSNLGLGCPQPQRLTKHYALLTTRPCSRGCRHRGGRIRWLSAGRGRSP